MACEVKFEGSIPFDCIRDLFDKAKSGTAKPRVIAKQSAWILGCVLETVEGVIEIPDVVTAKTDEEKLQILEEYFAGVHAAGAERPENIPPEVWAFFLQLLLKWMGGGFKRR